MQQAKWHADPLVWGHGPRVFEVFLEPTCPYSVKAFGKLDETLRLPMVPVSEPTRVAVRGAMVHAGLIN